MGNDKKAVVINIDERMVTREPLVTDASSIKPVDYSNVPDWVKEEVLNADKASSRSVADIKKEVVRVSTKLLDDMAKTAAEANIEHSRLEEYVIQLNIVAEDAALITSRASSRARDYEIEAETKISAQRQEIKASGREETEFDRLEFDEFNESQMRARALQEDIGDLNAVIESIHKIVSALSSSFKLQRMNHEGMLNATTQTRLETFGSQQTRLTKLIRQVSSQTTKEVIPEILGTEELIDRRAIEELMGPLEHIVRNAIDHGVEDAEERVKAGKDPKAKLTIKASSQNGETLIEIKDDGRGISLKKIREKAIEKGIIDADTEITHDDLADILTSAGFSTAAKLTNLSGRGVGMDVVKTAIRQLGGRLNIQTKEGEGTTMQIFVPLNTSTAKCLLVESAGSTYALPVNMVESVVVESGETINAMFKDQALFYTNMNEKYQFVSMQECVGLPYPGEVKPDQKQILVLVRAANHNLAIHIDQLLKTQVLVSQPSSEQVSKLSYVSATSILGTGEIVPVIDVATSVAQINKHGLDRSKVATAATVSGSGKTRVLVVDDSITIRKTMTKQLTARGYEVESAKDGADAINQLTNAEILPQIILLDIEMPGLDGFSVLSRVRKMVRTREIPVVMITSRTADKHRNHALSLGANEYMGKPPNMADLFAHIDNYTNSKKKASA